jgi:hypothetical protein
VHGTPRGTQSFVHILGFCWRRPSLLILEVFWRWICGLVLIPLFAWQAQSIWAQTADRLEATGVFQFSLQYPMQGALQVAAAIAVLRSPVLEAAAWLLPIAILAWSLAAGLGRNALLRHYNSALPWRGGTMIGLQLLRILALAASLGLWLAAVHWAAHYSLSPASANPDVAAEPNLVLYCALVIVFSLGIFTFWALLSWVFSIAPLLAVLENRSIPGSLVRSVNLGPLAGKLVEINLVMGIVKLALIVLAMVFSATPLPFEAEVHGASLYAWWAVVTVLYLVASDFFQVARVVAFAELWQHVVTAGAGLRGRGAAPDAE